MDKLKFIAIGDLLLTSRAPDKPERGLESLSPEIISLFKSSDIVFANLESTLYGDEKIPAQPRVISTETQINTIKDSGINIVTLGNNHAFDSYEKGFLRVKDKLDSMDIRYTGAGLNHMEAGTPLVFESKGIKTGIIPAVDRSTGNVKFSDKSGYGVPELDMEKILRLIKDLSGKTDLIIVSPHWGRERFLIPSPIQIKQARLFIEAGASMVLGHHPHVIQGMEIYKGFPIVYSMGNFLSNRVFWDNGDYLTWSRFERTGLIFSAEIDGGKIRNISRIPVYDDGKTISIDRTSYGLSRIKKVDNLLKKGVTQKAYGIERIRVEKIKPILNKLKPEELKKLKFEDLKKLISFIKKA